MTRPPRGGARPPRAKGAAAVALALACALALALPFALWDFRTYQLTLVAINAMVIVGLVALTGRGGRFSVGHSAFFGLGGYVSAVLVERAGVPIYLTFPLGWLAGFAAGYAFGRVVGRFEHVYLVLITFALSLAMPQLLKSSLLERLTGGVQGIYLDKPPAPFGLPLSVDQWWYFVTLGALALVMWTTRNLLAGRFGRAFSAVRDQPLAAAASGIDVARFRALAFAISAAHAALAGGLAATVMQFIAPDGLTIWLSILFIVGLVIGGAHSVYGAVIGGLFIVFAPDVAGLISRDLASVAYGGLLVVSIWLFPLGVAGMVGRLLPGRSTGQIG